MTDMLTKLAKAPDGSSNNGFLQIILNSIKLTGKGSNIDFLALDDNPLVSTILKQTSPLLSIKFLSSMFDVDKVMAAVDLKTIAESVMVTGASPTMILVSNIDYNTLIKEIKIENIVKNSFIKPILSGFVSGDLLDIIGSIDSEKLVKALDFDKIADAVMRFMQQGGSMNEAGVLDLVKKILPSINPKELANLLNIDQFIDVVLNENVIIGYLKQAGLSPELLKSILDSINVNNILKVLDFSKLVNYNGTSLADYYKFIVENLDLDKILPDIDIDKLLQIPQLEKLLNQTQVDPELVKTVIDSVKLSEFLAAVNIPGLLQAIRTNTDGDYIKAVLNNTDINALIKSVDIDKLFSHPLVAEFVRTQFKMDPMLAKLLLKNFNVGEFLKEVDTKAWSKLLVQSVNGTYQEFLEKVLDLVTIDALMQNINFKQLLENPEVKKILEFYGVDPIILEVVSSLGIEGLIKSIKFDEIIRDAIKSGNFDMMDILKKIMAQVDLTSILRNLDWKKLLNGATTGKLTNLPVSTECAIEIGKLVIAANQTGLSLENPAFKMLDAWGKPQSRLAYGNIFWMGGYEECTNLPNARYCLAQVPIGQIAPFMYGSCIPQVCTTGDFKKLLDVGYTVIQQGLKLSLGVNLPQQLPVNATITCGKEEVVYTKGFTVTIVIACIFVTLALLGTLFEYLESTRAAPSNNNSVVIKNIEFADLSTSVSSHQLADPEDEVKNQQETGEEEINEIANGDAKDADVSKIPEPEASPKEIHPMKKFFIAFAIHKNLATLLNAKPPKGTIKNLNGIRVITITWIIIGHIYQNLFKLPIDNGLDAKKVLNRYTMQTITNAHVSVDTFFLLSGLLVGYLTLKQMDKTKGKINIPMFYLHRFLRLTPTYAFVILLWVNVVPYCADSPVMVLDPLKPERQKCFDYWWTNILYINNFWPEWKNICMVWTWYLANDMQFYLVAPLILFAFHRLEAKYRGNKKYSKVPFIITGVICFISMLIVAILIGVIDAPMVNSEEQIDGNPRKGNGGTNSIYTKPYTRIQPYVIGLLLGYIFIRKITFQKMPMAKWINAVCWVLSITIGYVLVYGPYKTYRDPPTWFTDGEQILYGTFFRFLWSVCVAWVIYACHNGVGGFVDSLLSWNGWIPLSRLSYCAYLLHPLTVVHFSASFHNPHHYQDMVFAYYTLGQLAMTFIWSFFVAIFIEIPVMNLEKMAFNRKPAKKN
eukprot:TCONS_00021359-protein